MPEPRQGDRQGRKPEAATLAPDQTPTGEHDGRGARINRDVINGVASLGEPIGRGWIGIEGRTNDAGEFRVDVGFEVQHVPEGRHRGQGKHQPGPEP